jgi:pyridoxal phosphate enzyme (YggS family)
VNPPCPSRCLVGDSEPAALGDAPHAGEQPGTVTLPQIAIEEQDTASPRERPHGWPQLLAEAAIRDQPLAGESLAALHRPSYSAPMTAAERLQTIRDGIASAARAARRNSGEVTLIAVSKMRGAEAIEALIEAGQCDFGENRVQEALAKWPELLARNPRVRLHCIGRLQSNKAAEAVRLFDAIHSLDRPSLLDSLVKEAEKAERFPSVYVQVNIGDEPQKGGCPLADVADLVAAVRRSPLPLAGLMAIPPVGLEASPFFALLAKIAREHGISGLSMGMSADYKAAVMLGATAVRVGTALFDAD